MREIVVSSRACGSRDRVTIKVYDTLDAMRSAADAYNGTDNGPALAVTQVTCRASDHRAHNVTVRLARGHLGAEVVSHEMHHASAALYGAHVGDRINSLAHLNHHNESFAHLFSDLYAGLVRRLDELGYFD